MRYSTITFILFFTLNSFAETSSSSLSNGLSLNDFTGSSSSTTPSTSSASSSSALGSGNYYPNLSNEVSDFSNTTTSDLYGTDSSLTDPYADLANANLDPMQKMAMKQALVMKGIDAWYQDCLTRLSEKACNGAMERVGQKAGFAPPPPQAQGSAEDMWAKMMMMMSMSGGGDDSNSNSNAGPAYMPLPPVGMQATPGQLSDSTGSSSSSSGGSSY